MLMSEFVTLVLSEIRSFENNPPPAAESQKRIHPLTSREGEEQYANLIRYLLGHKNCQDDVSVHAKKMEQLCASRFHEKVFSRVFFHINPYSKVNFSYATLARKLAEIVNKPVYHLLMPAVKFTREIYSLSPYEFALVKRGDVFIPINIVDYLDNLNKPSSYARIGLTKKEIDFIVYHSDETRQYMYAILMNDEATKVSCREKLVQAMKQGNYTVTASFGQESDANLAKTLLPNIADQQELVAVIAGYIKKTEWSSCLDLINNKNLFKAILAIEFNQINLKSSEVESYLADLVRGLNEKYHLLETLFIYLFQKEDFLKKEMTKIPNIMRVISTLDMAGMLQQSKCNISDFKKLVEQEIKKQLLLLPKDCFVGELNGYSSWQALINTVVSLSAIQKQIHNFNLMSASDLFRILLNFDIEKYKQSQNNNLRGLSQDELLLIQFSDDLVSYLLKKDSITCNYDNFIRVYFLLLADLYKRQRDFKGDRLIFPVANKVMSGVPSKDNKIPACELFQHFLASDCPLHEFYAYPLNDDLLMQKDLSTLYHSLRSKTLGGIFDVALKFFDLFYRYKNTEKLSASRIQDEQHIACSFVGEVEGHQEKISYLATVMPEEAWKNFVNQAYGPCSMWEARKYLETAVLQHAADLNMLVDTLASSFPKDQWKAAVQSIGLVDWLSMVTGVNNTSVKANAKGNPIEFEAQLWKSVDKFFTCLEFASSHVSFVHMQAYCFCLAMTYKRQREKRSDYTAKGDYTPNVAATMAARTASLFKIKVASRCDKVSACEALIEFVLDENVQWSEEGLKDYLKKNYKEMAIKYFPILLSDSLGELTRKILACAPQIGEVARKKL